MELKLLPESKFDNKYEILSLLGSGGMGSVYKARQIDLGRIVALKLLKSALVEDDELRLRFQREAHALATLSHRNIGMFYSYGMAESSPYISMEFIEGRSLQSVIQEEGKIYWKRAISIAAQLCDALSYAHKAKVIHRDIKPGNIMLVSTSPENNEANSNSSSATTEPHSDFVKILDFGLAKVLAPGASEIQKLTQTGALVGSVQYLSPEMCSGIANDARSDIYSLACVLYEMITGTLPHDADNPIGMMHKHVTEPVIPISEKLQDPSLKILDNVLANALAKDPDSRYQTMDEFKEDLLLANDEKAGSLRDVARAERPSLVLVAGTVIAVLVACIEVFMFVQNSATGQALYAKLLGMESHDAASLSRNLSTLDRINAIGGYKESSKFMKELYDSSSKLAAFERAKLCLDFAKRSLKAGDARASTNWSAKGFHELSMASDTIPYSDYMSLCEAFAKLNESQSPRYNRSLDAPIDRMIAHYNKIYREPLSVPWREFEARQSKGTLNGRHSMRLLSLGFAYETSGNFAGALKAYEDSSRESLKTGTSRIFKCEILIDQARMHRALNNPNKHRELLEKSAALIRAHTVDEEAHVFKKFAVELIQTEQFERAKAAGDRFIEISSNLGLNYASDTLDLFKAYQSKGRYAEGLEWLEPHLKSLHKSNSEIYQTLLRGISSFSSNQHEKSLFSKLDKELSAKPEGKI